MAQLSSYTAVIVDEHPLWLDALQSLLERLEVEVVARATTGQEAVEIIRDHRPDVVVADYAAIRKEGSGGGVLDAARHANPGVRCVILSESDDRRERELAFAAGAAAFCVKRAEPDDVAAAIRQSFDHSIYFADASAPAAVEASAIPTSPDPQGTVGLTKREVEILRLTAEGYSNSQLARMLWVTEQTVKFHLSNIYRKLSVSNRTEASRWAQRNGILSGEPLEATAA